MNGEQAISTTVMMGKTVTRKKTPFFQSPMLERRIYQQFLPQLQQQQHRSEFDFKVDIPEFERKSQPDEFLDWIHTVERVFDFKEVPEDRKVELVALKPRKYTGLWWENLKRQRTREGNVSFILGQNKGTPTMILTWKLQGLLHIQLHNFKQHTSP